MNLTDKGNQLLWIFRQAFELLGDHQKRSPKEVAVVLGAVVSHLRSSWPLVAVEAPSMMMAPIEDGVCPTCGRNAQKVAP